MADLESRKDESVVIVADKNEEADNSSAKALKEFLTEEPLTINMSDYASMEKVRPIGTSLPRNDEQIATGDGDIILHQGNSLVIYYDTNAWTLTRIGKINDVTKAELLEALRLNIVVKHG